MSRKFYGNYEHDDAQARCEIRKVLNDMKSIERRCIDESRDMTTVEQSTYGELLAQFETIRNQIEEAPSLGRQTDPNPIGKGVYNSGARVGRGPAGDWYNMGEFAIAVRRAQQPGGMTDPRLVMNAPTTTSTEGVGADGGFAVPPDFRDAIWQKVGGEGSLLALTDQYKTPSNAITVPADENPPWSSSGPQANWEGETEHLTQSKLALAEKTIRLNKLTALVPVSSELQEDAPSLAGYLQRKVSQIFGYKIDFAFIRGTGAGQPLGWLNAGCLKSVAKESGQAADTIQFENILNLFSALDPASIEGAIWVANPDVRPQLMQLEYPSTSGQVLPVFMPGQNLSGAPFSTLMGLPIIFSFAAPPLGDKGDISLVNLKSYMTALKVAGMRADVSMHLWFDYDVLSYRFILRIAGQPWPASVIVAPDGSTEYSSFVALDARA